MLLLNKYQNNRVRTLFLRTAVLCVSIAVTLLSFSAIFSTYRNLTNNSSALEAWSLLLILVVLAVAITFNTAAYQIWKLLSLIDNNKAFTKASVSTMKNVKYCGFTISALFGTLLPLVSRTADNDDAPGMIVIYGAIFIAIPFVVAVFAGVAQQLFQNAIDIKKENDLTV